MTTVQKLQIRLSEIRSKLNELSGVADLSDEQRNEIDALSREYQGKEAQHRAALIAEGEEQRAAEGEFGNVDGEAAETRALLGRVNVADYLKAAAAGIGLAGAPVELAAALKVPAVGRTAESPCPGGCSKPRSTGPYRHRAAKRERSRLPARSTAARCNVRSFNVCSAWTYSGRSACASTPFRPG